MTRGQDVTAGDVLAEIDRAISRVRATHGLIQEIDVDWAHGVEDSLVHLRSVIRSKWFADRARRQHNKQETPTNAH